MYEAAGGSEGIVGLAHAWHARVLADRALALEHPMVYQLMFLRTVPGFEPSDRALEVAAASFANLVTGVRRAMTAGVIAEGEPTETAQLIWSSIHGWVSLEVMGIGFVEDQQAGFDRVCSTMLDGLSPETVRRRRSSGSVTPARA